MPDSFPHRIIPSTKSRTSTVVSPDDEAHNRPKHVEIDKYKLAKTNCAPSWFYVQDYIGMDGQQNTKCNKYNLKSLLHVLPHPILRQLYTKIYILLKYSRLKNVIHILFQ